MKTLGTYPKESKLHLKHGKNLKSRIPGSSPENSLSFIEVPVTPLTKHQSKQSRASNNKPNSLKHVSHIVPKLQ
jgi:hypothetical protein